MGNEKDVEGSSAKVFIRNVAGSGFEYKTMEQIMQDYLHTLSIWVLRICYRYDHRCDVCKPIQLFFDTTPRLDCLLWNLFHPRMKVFAW